MKTLAFILLLSTTAVLAAPPDGYLASDPHAAAVPVAVEMASLPVDEPSADPARPAAPVAEPALAQVKAKLSAILLRTFRNPRTLTVSLVPEKGTPLSLGRFASLAVDFTEGRFDIVPVAKANLRIDDLVLDVGALMEHGQFRLVESRPLDARLVVSQAGLNEVLSVRRDSLAIENPEIVLRDGKVHLAARFKTFFIKGRIATSGKFAVPGGNAVHFVPDKVTVGVVSLPSRAVEAVARKINPVFVLSKLRAWHGLSFHLTRIQIEGDCMVLESADPSRFEPIAAR